MGSDGLCTLVPHNVFPKSKGRSDRYEGLWCLQECLPLIERALKGKHCLRLSNKGKLQQEGNKDRSCALKIAIFIENQKNNWIAEAEFHIVENVFFQMGHASEKVCSWDSHLVLALN